MENVVASVSEIYNFASNIANYVIYIYIFICVCVCVCVCIKFCVYISYLDLLLRPRKCEIIRMEQHAKYNSML